MSGTTNVSVALGAIPSGATVVAFTGSGTWDVPVGITEIDILLVGGGGAGNGSSGSPGIANGGGSGGCVAEYLSVPVTPGDTLSVFVGTGATDGNEDGTGSEVDAPGPVVLATAGPGVGCNVSNPADFGNGGGGMPPFGQPFAAGGVGGPGGFNGGDGTGDDSTFAFFYAGGGAGAGADGFPGSSDPGNGGDGKDMSGSWGTTYGESGVFAGGGGGSGYRDPGGLPSGAPGLGQGPNSGGGGTSSFAGLTPAPGQNGIVLIRYTP